MSKPNTSRHHSPPPPHELRLGGNLESLRQCIREARLAARNPEARPAERHLHRIVASAGLQTLYHLKRRKGARATRAVRLVNDAMRQLENIRLEITS
jgi:hypothetical protein